MSLPREQPKGRKPRSLLGNGDILTRTQISRRIGMDRGTLAKYLGMEGAPKPDKKHRMSLVAVRAWLEANAAKASNNQEMRGLKETLLRMDVEERAIELGVKKGQFIERAKIRPAIEAVMGRLTVDMQAILEGEIPPKVVGKSANEVRELMAAAVDRVLKRMREGWGAIA